LLRPRHRALREDGGREAAPLARGARRLHGPSAIPGAGGPRGMSLSAVEVRRKAVHVGCGLFALAFARLTWHEAALAALAALAFASYVVFGSIAAVALFGVVAHRETSLAERVALVLGALVGALFESLPSELDDNLVAPLAGAGAAAALLPAVSALAAIASADWIRRAGW